MDSLHTAKRPEDLHQLEPSELLQNWDVFKRQLDYYKTMEMEARKLITARAFAADLPKGTHTLSVGAGASLKFTKSFTYKLSTDLGVITEVRTAILDGISSLFPDKIAQAHSLFKDKIELHAPTYEKLVDSTAGQYVTQALRDVLTISEASPKLELVVKE